MTNLTLPFGFPDAVVTSMKPVVAPAGTAAKISVSDSTVNAGATPLTVTLVALERSSPRIWTVLSTLPDDSAVSTKDLSLACPSKVRRVARWRDRGRHGR